MIPGGILKGHTEFYWLEQDGFVMQDGHSYPVLDMSPDLKSIVDAKMNPKHHQALDNMGIKEADARRIKFLQCNSGAYDFTSDIVDGKMQLEYVACPLRGSCSEEGKLCQPLKIEALNATLTMGQLRAISHIRKGLYDKEICVKENIKIQTLRTQKQIIERKLDADRKVEVALKAVEYGIM